jgi:hypothetical protein
MMNQQDDRNQFEFFLQDSLKDFRMVPGSRVWKSLYNNLHPGRRWPAFSTMLLFVCCLSFFDKNHRAIPLETATFVHKPINFQQPSSILDNSANIDFDQQPNAIPRKHEKELMVNQENQRRSLTLHEASKINNPNLTESSKSDHLMMIETIIPAKKRTGDLSINHPTPIFNSIQRVQPDSKKQQHKSTIEYTTKQKDSKFSIAYTLTPSVGYRFLRQVSNTANIFPINASFGEERSDFYQKPTMNMEAGVLVHYKIRNKISLVGGLQLNYMGYRIEATEWEQPVQTELEYLDPNTGETRLMNTTSTLAKVTNGSKIRHNYSVDVSIPVGLSMAVIDKNKWQCRLQGTLQPGLKISDKTALISANQSSYIYEPRMINQWSLFAGMAAQVVIPVDKNLQLSFGPSVRYQLSRQFQTSYVYRENRYNAGMTISLLKSF